MTNQQNNKFNNKNSSKTGDLNKKIVTPVVKGSKTNNKVKGCTVSSKAVTTPKTNIKTTFSKKGNASNNDPNYVSKKLSMLLVDNKYSDILSILDSIFGENLDNYSENLMNNVMDTFDVKNMAKALIHCVYNQKIELKNFEERELNVSECNKTILLQEERINQLNKEIASLKQSRRGNSKTPYKQNYNTEDSLNCSRISNFTKLNHSKLRNNLNDESLIERKVLKKKYIK